MNDFSCLFLILSWLSLIIADPVTTNVSNPVLQDLVTWDEHSFFIRGERMFLFSGEVHPFRIPSPGLYLDVFQKIKSMGFNCVSFYTDWALLEGARGIVVTDGIWDLKPFFAAAAEAGVYLIARPGPYINAETAAGGMPGWTLRMKSVLRSDDADYLNATKLYLQTIGRIIAEAQITNGGPVVLVQPENEYSTWPNVSKTSFPLDLNRQSMAFIEHHLRKTGIIVPFISNDNEGSNSPTGYFAPGTGLGAVDIYGIDAYPMRYDCANPEIWPTYRFPRDWQLWHEQVSPGTPFAIPEFQGGSGTGYGGVGQEMCNELVNEESVRVLWKNNFGFGTRLMNVYMMFGGTNWGNLGYQGGDTSYDYGAAISENRHIDREKYSEQKLQANFLKVSPAYLTARPENSSNGSYVLTDQIAVTPLFGTEHRTNFYIVRHADFTSKASTEYTLTVPTSLGNVTIPQLWLNGRDSKIHVTDYDVGGVGLVYCTAEIFTWVKGREGRRVLIMYGGASERHEFALPIWAGEPTIKGVAEYKRTGKSWIISWDVNIERQIVYFPGVGLQVYLLWRNEVYTYWTLELPGPSPIGNYSSPSKESVIIKGGYLLRTAHIDDRSLSLTGDLNATTDLEIIYEPTGPVNTLLFNGVKVDTRRNDAGNLHGVVAFSPPTINLPDFRNVEWKYIDSLPELDNSYDDSLWTDCNLTSSNNTVALKTPTNLYASDYGYHTGSLLYRGHFIATDSSSPILFLNVSGGNAFAHSVWLNSTFIGSWTGDAANQTYAQTFSLPSLITNEAYVLTVLIDHMGQDEEAPGTDAVKFPKGILNYTLPGAEISWKMTGNLDSEDYRDQIRGPRNEGGMFAERQGFHLPMPPSENWMNMNPLVEGVEKAGVGFFTTKFELHIPRRYDVPLSFVFNDGTIGGENYRVQLFVNGWQFGKYVDNLGPQTEFPVPEGVLNYEGTNYLALTLWAMEEEGANLEGLNLVSRTPVRSGYFEKRLGVVEMGRWEKRDGTY